MSYLAFLLSAVMISPSDVMAPGKAPAERLAASALLAGILLTAAHPYFLLWWASVGAQLVRGEC